MFCLGPRKSKFLKNEKNLGDIIILDKCTIHDSHMMYGSWDMEQDGQNFLSFWSISGTFTPLTTQKIKILKKWKNQLEILSFYTGVHKWQSCDVWFWDKEHDRQNFLSFWVLFCPFTPPPPPLTTQKIRIFKKWKKLLEILSFYIILLYDVCFLSYGGWQTGLFVIFDHILPFYLHNNLKNQNFKKLKYAPTDIIILHKCTKNQYHMLYGSWDMAHNGLGVTFHFELFFALLPP